MEVAVKLFGKEKHGDKRIVYFLGFKISYKKKDRFALDSGERQVATDVSNIRKDHLHRYNLGISYIKKLKGSNIALKGADIFCGNGYGSYLISRELPNSHLISIDACADAINLAKNYYHSNRIIYKRKLFPFRLPKNKYDFIFSLESVEHVKNDDLFLDVVFKAIKKEGILILSCPNEEKQNLAKNPNEFHYRHYFFEEFTTRLQEKGFKLLDWYGQDTYKTDSEGVCQGLLDEEDMELKKSYNGQFLVFILQKQ